MKLLLTDVSIYREDPSNTSNRSQSQVNSQSSFEYFGNENALRGNTNPFNPKRIVVIQMENEINNQPIGNLTLEETKFIVESTDKEIVEVTMDII